MVKALIISLLETRIKVNVPVLRQFVDSLYPSVLDLVRRKKNLPWVSPLVQLLLAVSQKQYFLNHWSIFLDHCLSAIKDNKELGQQTFVWLFYGKISFTEK